MFLVGIALFITVSMLLKDGNFSFSKKKGYRLHVIFDSIAGIEPEAKVRVAGVDAGKMEEIRLRSDGKVDVTLWISSDIIIRAGAAISIKSRGLIGEKYFEISSGDPNEQILMNGDYINSAEGAADIDALAAKLGSIADDIKAVTSSFKETLASEEGKASMNRILKNVDRMTSTIRMLIENNRQGMNEVVSNLRTMTGNINEMVKVNREDVRETIRNVHETSVSLKEAVMNNQSRISGIVKNLENFSSDLNQEFPKMTTDIQQLVKKLDIILAENREIINTGIKNINSASRKIDETMDSVDKITDKVASGKGTIGKLVFDESAYNDLDKGLKKISWLFEKMDRLRLYLGARVEYLGKHEDAKSYFTIKIQPREDKYYLLEVVDNPEGKINNITTDRTITENGVKTETVTEEKETTSDLKFTLQLAKRYYFVGLRGGVMESAGGVGIDFYFLNDDLRVRLDAWDLADAEPHLRAKVQYFFSDQVFLNFGGDDLASSERASFFVGAGFLFGDDDIKYLLNRIPVPTN
ncbi:MAG: MlaD family protein [bacterium]